MIQVIKFSKDGCRPCAILSNILSEIDFPSHGAELVEINISDREDLIEMYGLVSVPVLVFEKDGKVVDRINGLTHAEIIIDRLMSLLS